MKSGPGRWAGLAARFDERALQPYAWPPSPLAQASDGWPALQAWCLASPARRLAVAVPAADPGARAAAQAEACALQLDGSHALHACRSAAARWRLRLTVKWQDLLGPAGDRSALPPDCIWDAGRARGDTAALARFLPRRPSFIVIDSGSAATWAPALAALHQRSAGWRFPVRLLWLLPERVPLAADSLPAA